MLVTFRSGIEFDLTILPNSGNIVIAIEFQDRPGQGVFINAKADEARWLAMALNGAADAIEKENG